MKTPRLVAALLLVASCATAGREPTSTAATSATTTTSQPIITTTTQGATPAPGFEPVDHPVVVGVRASTASVDAANVLDLDLSTTWTAEGDAPQWIEFHLGEPVFISSIRVAMSEHASGIAVHDFRAGAHDNPGRSVGSMEVEAGLGTGFEVFVDYVAEFVRITTTSSTGPITWADVEIKVEG